GGFVVGDSGVATTGVRVGFALGFGAAFFGAVALVGGGVGAGVGGGGFGCSRTTPACRSPGAAEMICTR
ncbi:MAG TPA: hypothetical protein VHV78_10355, partial [Gemmatimonadaceae bacterium]|nr:hypothetical protein [Gemmatimonadaceae bacterium]